MRYESVEFRLLPQLVDLSLQFPVKDSLWLFILENGNMFLEYCRKRQKL